MSDSEKKTKDIAGKIAGQSAGGKIIALEGPLGAGKTTFAQGFAQALGIKEPLQSPTFILMRQYKIPGNEEGKLFHIDPYRLEDRAQAQSLGLDEIFANPRNIVLIEWADKLREELPKHHIRVQMKILSPEKREITVAE